MREEGTLRDALGILRICSGANPFGLLMDIRPGNYDTKQTRMTKFRDQEDCREEPQYREREGGIVCKFGRQSKISNQKYLL